MSRILSLLIVFFCLTLTAGAQLTEFANQKRREAEQKQLMERQRYEESLQKGTPEALEKYLQYYPKGKYSAEVQQRLKDFRLWDKATKENNIESYTSYLTESSYRYFAEEAEARIVNIQAEKEWNSIKSAPTIERINNFITNFPKASVRSEAERLLHEFEAVRLYENNEYERALNEFNAAGGRARIAEANREAYNRCAEEHDYKALLANSSREELFGFLSNYPSGKYSAEVSDRYARSLARSFDRNVNELQRDVALRYAKEDTTRNFVRNMYSSHVAARQAYDRQKEKEEKEAERRYKRRQRRAGGRMVQFGLVATDFAYSVNDDKDLPKLEWNLGLNVKFGNFTTPVQFEIGLLPGILCKDEEDAYKYIEEDKTETKFHMPVYAKAKVNLCDLKTGKFYLGAAGYYNPIRYTKFPEGRFAWSSGVGWAWQRWDWTILYYKRDIGRGNNQKVGCAIACYF